jgi:small conductance mechanosensitive channel
MPLAAVTPAVDTVCENRGWACPWLFEQTGNESLSRTVGWLLEKPLQIALVLLLAWAVNRVLRTSIRRIGDRAIARADQLGAMMPDSLRRADRHGRSQARAETISYVARSVATGTVVLIALGCILGVLGVGWKAFLASAGVIGVALGFGAQTLIRDLLAGWFVVVEDRYGVGDVVDLGVGAVGTVERITLRSTRLRAQNGNVWHVNNGEVLRVANKSQSWSRALVDVVVAVDANVDEACRVLAEVGIGLHGEPEWATKVRSEPDVLGVHLIDPTGVTLRVLCETEPADQFEVEREYRLRVLRAFDAEGIPLAQAVMQRPDAAAP